MSEIDVALEAKAAKLLVAALIDAISQVAPGTIPAMDAYMVELLSRPAIDPLDRGAITVTRAMLEGLGPA